MLTKDKSITTAGYWQKVYRGARPDAKVDSSNNVRPANAFDRFGWVADQVTAEDTPLLEIGAGHARICERVRAKYPNHLILASDQTQAAMLVSKFKPYDVFNAYNIPAADKSFRLVVAAQCLEYFENLPALFQELERVSDGLLCTIPKGEMKSWSQLYIFDEHNFKAIIEQYGTVTHEAAHDDLLMYKLKFHE